MRRRGKNRQSPFHSSPLDSPLAAANEPWMRALPCGTVTSLPFTVRVIILTSSLTALAEEAAEMEKHRERLAEAVDGAVMRTDGRRMVSLDARCMITAFEGG